MTNKRKNAAPFITVPLAAPGVPVYRQIYETLRRAILSGHLPADSQMPSTRSLAKQLVVSRMTVVNAYDLLLAEGYIEGVSGSGTYVAPVLPEELLEIGNVKTQKSETPEKPSPMLSKRGRLLASFDHTYLRASRTDIQFAAFHPGIPALRHLVAARFKAIKSNVRFPIRFGKSGWL